MNSQTRQEFVRAGVSFLQSPNLRFATLADKLEFLRNKGLSQIEIDETLNLALINRNKTQTGKWNFLLVLCLCLGGYQLYRNYSQPIEEPIVQKKKTKPETSPGEKLLAPINPSVENSKLSLSDILKEMSALKEILNRQRDSFQSEIQSIKKLLMSHKNFPAPPVLPPWPEHSLDVKKNSTVEPVKPADLVAEKPVSDIKRRGKKDESKSQTQLA